MNEQPDAIDNPITRERVTFSQRARDTGGDLLRFELVMEAGGARMVEHVHLRQEERIEVVAGTVRYRLGGTERGLAAGEAVVLPPGVAHTLWNDGAEEARMLFEVRPALKAEAAFETLFGLARDGKTNKQGMPNPLQGALLALEYETFLARPPIRLQRAVLAVLAPVARLLGYRPRYSKYSGPE
jgi:quercetin dioxygenase-like cupin family protein